MKKTETLFWRNYIANIQLHVSIAQSTKVPNSWKATDYTPDFNKFYFIQSGTGFVKMEDKVYFPKPGDLYLLPADTTQSYGTTSNDTFNKYWCHFTAKVGDSPLFNLIDAPLFIKVNDQKKVKEQFEQLIHFSQEDSLSSLFHMNAILLQLIASMLDKSGKMKSKPFSNPSFEKMDYIINYVETHLSESFSVEKMAAIAGFHPNYFIQLFKQFTGTSPIRFLNQRRMEKARHLLATTDQNICDIADNVGMEVSYFSRMFREQIGFSPSQFREVILNRT
ncbi:AraC family transcriptional regulator [Lederbergia lenta]|uniref:AraC family transcriptional regulator n=1 Tax=Lederbergia lenta TaxID=1467 RepID=UPI0020412242|nr:AraC family transcriptional regulator [Lederbergia lenta]MCM3111156.1 AraC family transcriptional regulator [Lederbergia lenta]